jgi:Rod binding domain-containing protein
MEITTTNQIQDSKKNVDAKQIQQQKIDDIAQNFESIFVKMMFSKMTATLDQSFFGDGAGSHIYQGMFEDKLSSYVTEKSDLGVQSTIKSYLNNRLGTSGIADFSADEKNLESAEDIGQQLMFDSNILKRAMSHKNTLDKKTTPENYSHIISEASEKYNVPKELITAVIRAESNGDSEAVSKAGAKGLMQLMDSTAEELNVQNVFNPAENIYGGTKYLNQLLKQFDGNLEKTLAAYNAGPSNVKKYNGVPPFPETQNYVKKIMHELNEVKHEK